MNEPKNWWKSPVGIALTIILIIIACVIAFFTVCTIMVFGNMGGGPP